MKFKITVTGWIMIGLVAGILTGYLYREYNPDEASIAAFSSNISILSDIFLRLIKMIIAFTEIKPAM